MIYDRIYDDIPPQMKILNMVIPILMYFLTFTHRTHFGYTTLNIHEIWFRLLLGEHSLYIRAQITSFVNSLD